MIGRSPVAAIARAVAAAALFSTGGAAIKTAAWSGMQVASARSGIAALALLLWMRGRLTLSLPVLVVSSTYAATLLLFVSSTKLTTAASAIFLQSAAPLYIVVLAPLILGERFRPRDLGVLAAAGAGLALCVAGGSPATATAPDPSAGNLLGVLSSLSWAFTLVGLRWVERRKPGAGMSAVVAGNLIAFSIGLPTLVPLPPAAALDWAVLAYLGVVQIGLAYVLLVRAVRELPALHTSLLLLIEPVLNPVWAWLVRGESPGVWTLLGGAVIVAAAAGQAASQAWMPAVVPAKTGTRR